MRLPVYSIMIRDRIEIGRRLRGFKDVTLPRGLLPLDQLRAAMMDERNSGVYFLWRGPQLVYIGRSVHVPNRAYQHAMAGTILNPKGKVMPWTRVSAFSCSRDELADVELAYILAYRPPYNDKFTH